MRRIPSPSTLTLPSWGMLLQAARRALRPRPDGALSGGVDFRDASDHGASADTRTPCMAPSRRQRLVSVILVASARLNSRKNKDKSERQVTCFVRVPGMCEARPRYQGNQAFMRVKLWPGQWRDKQQDKQSNKRSCEGPFTGCSSTSGVYTG